MSREDVSREDVSRQEVPRQEVEFDRRRDDGVERSGVPSRPAPESPVDDVPLGPAPKPREPGARGAGEPVVKEPRTTRARRSANVESYLRRLQGSPEVAGNAFRGLWIVQKRLIPRLILEVENPSPTGIRELKILVLDKRRLLRKVALDPGDERVVYTNEEGDKFVHDVPGMGKFAYSEMSVGPARRGDRSAKVVVRSLAGFPLGVVIRAALLNRFQSSAYPRVDPRIDLRTWWQRFYEMHRSSL